MTLRDQHYAAVRHAARECEEAVEKARLAGCTEVKTTRELLAGREEGKS